MSEGCINHPDRPAVEHCEVCAEPLCGYCLWYAQDGLRLCERHARARQAEGLQVYAPAHFAGAIEDSHAGVAHETSREAQPTWHGNRHDVLALVVATAGLTSVLFSLGLAYCVPVVAGLLALSLYGRAAQAVDERRTRELSLLGMSGMVVSVGWLLFVFLACCVCATIPIMVGLLSP